MPAPLAPRPARKGAGWKVFAVILLLLLLVSIAFNLRSLVSGVVNIGSSSERGGGSSRIEEVTVKDNESSSKIAVIDVTGVITGEALEQTGLNMVTLIKDQLRRAKNDHEVKAVILKVDSPGGEVLAADDIARAISDFEDKSSKPVVVPMGSLAASGGYYVSAPCTWIVANELTITGSIGVIMHGFNYRGLLDKVGVQPMVFKSGKFKDMLSSTKEPEEVTAEEREMIQNMINETFDKFKSVVAEGRERSFTSNKNRGKAGKMLSKDWESFADGRILSGKEAYRRGFVDELGDFEVAVSRAEEIAHIKGKANLIKYQPIFNLSDIFRMFGKSDAKSLKVDLGVEIPKLRPGCMYFLAPSYVR